MVALIFILFCAVLLPGMTVKIRSFFAGRKGRNFFQHVSDMILDFKKGSVYSSTSSYVTKIATSVDIASAIIAMLCVPVGAHESLISFQGDIIFMLYIMSLGKVLMIFAAMDSSSAFGGMGASREAFYNILCEPAFMILMATLCMVTGTWSFSQLFATFGGESVNLLVLSILVGYGIFKLALTETCRVPVDDPKTHLELTMIHEAQILEFSGPDMALIKISTWIKSAIWCILCINTLVPYDLPIYKEFLFLLSAMAIFALSVSFVETFKARSSLVRNPLYILSISAIALLALTVGFVILLSPTI